jgi:hypothetical protein
LTHRRRAVCACRCARSDRHIVDATGLGVLAEGGAGGIGERVLPDCCRVEPGTRALPDRGAVGTKGLRPLADGGRAGGIGLCAIAERGGIGLPRSRRAGLSMTTERGRAARGGGAAGIRECADRRRKLAAC